MFPRIGVQVVDDPPLEVGICWIANKVQGSTSYIFTGSKRNSGRCTFVEHILDIYCMYVYTLSMRILHRYNMYIFMYRHYCSGEVTWQGKIIVVNRTYIFKMSIVHCHIAMLVYQNVYSTTIC